MLSPSSATIRLFLHVLAASVWVGGQITMAGLLPTVRALGGDAPKRLARQFNRVAWPAFGLLVVTGIWNLLAIEVSSTSTERQATVMLHVTVAALSGVSAGVHAGTRSRLLLGLTGAAGAITALAALFVGVLLRSA